MKNVHKEYAKQFESAGWTVLEYDRTGFFLEADQIKGYVVVIDNGEITSEYLKEVSDRVVGGDMVHSYQFACIADGPLFENYYNGNNIGMTTTPISPQFLLKGVVV